MKALNGLQQANVRLALGAEIARLKTEQRNRSFAWPYGDGLIGELEEVLNLFYHGDIFVGYADEIPAATELAAENYHRRYGVLPRDPEVD